MPAITVKSSGIGGSVLLAAGLLTAPAANAAPVNVAEAALEATLSRADEAGLDVISSVTSSRRHTWPASTIEIPARVPIRHHVEIDTGGSTARLERQ